MIISIYLLFSPPFFCLCLHCTYKRKSACLGHPPPPSLLNKHLETSTFQTTALITSAASCLEAVCATSALSLLYNLSLAGKENSSLPF